MKKLLMAALIGFGMTSLSATADVNWEKLASVNPDGIQWDVYVDNARTNKSQHKGWFKMVQVGGEPSGYYHIETQAIADCKRKRIKNPIFQPYQNYGKQTMDTPDGKTSQPWHKANKGHAEGIILKHLCP
ncbi:MAG: hypothetical protein IK089_07120 [Oxalobacter sp.]|nr:hypothetical protein [Oxalobacter sp.]